MVVRTVSRLRARNMSNQIQARARNWHGYLQSLSCFLLLIINSFELDFKAFIHKRQKKMTIIRKDDLLT